MHARHIQSYAAAFLALLLLPVAAPTANAGLDDRYRPALVTGDLLPAWTGTDSAEFRVYRWSGAAFEAIPFQFDDFVVRVFEAWPPTGVPEHEELTFDWDGEEDGTLDDDDELTAMPWDFGLEAPDAAWSGSGENRYQLSALDPLTGETRYAYVFIDPTGPLSPIDYVQGHVGAAGSFETDRYRIVYEDRWLLTEWRVKAELGGDGGDLIDRVKGRVGDPADPLETEEGWNESATLLGNIDGPVRAAREVLGAASGPHTTHVDIAYARHAERTVHLRLHAAPRIAFYFDLDPSVLPGEYDDDVDGPHVLDGVPHAHPEHFPDWSLATTPSGSLLVDFRELTEFPPDGPDGRTETYHVDDESLEDGTGEITGAHGNFGAQLWDIDDTNATPYVTQQLWVPMAPDTDPATFEEPEMFHNPVLVGTQLQQRPQGEPDDDGDGVPDVDDNCPAAENPQQLDADDDGVGDTCDPCPEDLLDDSDGDGSCDSADACAGFDDSLDADADGNPDDCDDCPADALDDSDGDGSCDSDDACPGFDDASDADGDGLADGCDACPLDAADDSDGDGSCDSEDSCPGFDDAADADADGVADGCDACPDDALDDSDGDTACDSDDRCPGFDDREDADLDSVPDGCDVCTGFDDAVDTDGDGVANGCEACPGFDDTVDGDGDGLADGCDGCPLDAANDADGDGHCADRDNCSGVPNADQADSDGDGRGDVCDACPGNVGDDSDGDGTCDSEDACPGFDDALDADADGSPDACDPCPADALDDSDGDGACDSDDACAGFNDAIDGDGDGVADGCDPCPADAGDDTDADGSCDSDDSCPGFDDLADADADGVADACDACPDDALDDTDGDGSCDSDDRCPGFDDRVDADADGVADGCDACPIDANDDSDADGHCDSGDNCPATPNADQADTDSDGIGDACQAVPVTLFVTRAGDDLLLSWTPGLAPFSVSSSEDPDRVSFTVLDDAVPVETYRLVASPTLPAIPWKRPSSTCRTTARCCRSTATLASACAGCRPRASPTPTGWWR